VKGEPVDGFASVQELGEVTVGVGAYWHWTVDDAVQVLAASAQLPQVATAQVVYDNTV
jgi:hypothetical protein